MNITEQINNREGVNKTMNKCPTCVKPLNNPYRRYNRQGQIIEGCIDKCHDKHLIPTTNSYNWVIECRKHNKQLKKHNTNKENN